MSTVISLSPFATPPIQSTPAESFEKNAAVVLGRLQEAFRAFLTAIPGGVKRAADLQRAFELDSKLAGQVFKVATAANPAAACVNVPPRVSLDRMLRTAATRDVPPVIIERMIETYERFQRLVGAEATSREELESMLAAFDPEERARQELSARHSAFKGMSHIKGVAAEVEICTHVIHPTKDETRGDWTLLTGVQGLRRLRSDAPLSLGTIDQTDPNAPVFNLDGEICGGDHDAFLRQFSSDPMPAYVARRSPDGTISHQVTSNLVGMRSAVNLLIAERRVGVVRLKRDADAVKKKTGFACRVDRPARRLLLDIFLHRDAFPNVQPTMEVLDPLYAATSGASVSGDQDDFRLPTTDAIQRIIGGIQNAHVPFVPRYVEMLENVCSKLGLDAQAFRGFRLDIQYPIYGGQYGTWFDIPLITDQA